MAIVGRLACGSAPELRNRRVGRRVAHNTRNPASPMIDVHSHVLWGIDDGPGTLEESMAMLRDAAATGTTDIVATPHANEQFGFDPELIESRLAELRNQPERIPQLHRGCDFHLSASNIEDALLNPGKYTINGRQYLLVEFPEMFIWPESEQILFRLSCSGILPIVTHPERNRVLQRDRQKVKKWVEAGHLMQLTACSLLGRFGNVARDTAWDLIASGSAHIVASDAHDREDRHAKLDEAYRAVAARLGDDHARLLFFSNPEAVILGGPVPEATTAPTRKWYRFRR